MTMREEAMLRDTLTAVHLRYVPAHSGEAIGHGVDDMLDEIGDGEWHASVPTAVPRRVLERTP
jgi:hypothetical protein